MWGGAPIRLKLRSTLVNILRRALLFHEKRLPETLAPTTELSNAAPQQKESAMDLEQLAERYFRLKQELSMAYRSQLWQSSRIDRLADDLSEVEHDIAALHPTDEQCGPTDFAKRCIHKCIRRRMWAARCLEDFSS
jgi:hypothetical protein